MQFRENCSISCDLAIVKPTSILTGLMDSTLTYLNLILVFVFAGLYAVCERDMYGKQSNLGYLFQASLTSTESGSKIILTK